MKVGQDQLGWEVCVHDSASDKFVSGKIQRGQVYEGPELLFLSKVLHKCPDCAFFDIGANIGEYTMMAASMGHSVISVDPLPCNTVRVRKAITRGQFGGDKVVIFQNAISNVRTSMHLMSRRSNVGATRIVCRDQCITNEGTICLNETVDTIYLDDLVPTARMLNIKRAVMKIDIEGHEPFALQQSEMLFQEVDIHFIQMEWNVLNSIYGSSMEEVVEKLIGTLRSRGYKPVALPSGKKTVYKLEELDV